MSNTDSFIDEVTEEVRREKLFQTFRRYGWIGVLAVVLIVGGAAWNEYRKAQVAGSAQALGDGILAALRAEESDARQEALAQIAVEGRSAGLVALIAAAEAGRAGDAAGAAQRLRNIAGDTTVPALYRDLALLKALIAEAGVTPPAERITALGGLTAAGAPFRLLAQEQIALAQLEAGQDAEAVATLQAIAEDAETPATLGQRVATLLQALGAEAAE